MLRETFDARDIWTAAFLHASGVPFEGCYMNDAGQTRWTFADRETAWEASRAWRDETPQSIISGPALMWSFREMSRVSHEAGYVNTNYKNRETGHGNLNNNAA